MKAWAGFILFLVAIVALEQYERSGPTSELYAWIKRIVLGAWLLLVLWALLPAIWRDLSKWLNKASGASSEAAVSSAAEADPSSLPDTDSR